MSEMESIPPPRTPPDPGRMQNDVIEEHMELWWFNEPVKSIMCYSLSVLLILLTGIGGIVLLSTTTTRSGEWRLVVGAILCLLSLLILLKQLLSSAVQDMQCVQRRERIEMLKSGGFSDTLVFILSGIIILVCGVALLILSFTNETPGLSPLLVTMHTVGITLIVVGATILFGVLVYAIVTNCKSYPSARFNPRNISVFSISGHLNANQRQTTTSSMANLI
ncbi:transmembrane protein 125 [Bombina bombina]|uniref:transmembrane protein 125 n=1 Tax=Bombina bombina TaxID=8345 RepID=UPI00235A8301|nr:transmembrane protein 125 [Bombina bombina]